MTGPHLGWGPAVTAYLHGQRPADDKVIVEIGMTREQKGDHPEITEFMRTVGTEYVNSGPEIRFHLLRDVWKLPVPPGRTEKQAVQDFLAGA